MGLTTAAQETSDLLQTLASGTLHLTTREQGIKMGEGGENEFCHADDVAYETEQSGIWHIAD